MSDGTGCKSPIEAAVLADYWIGALASSEEQAVEEHFLGCQSCAARLGEMSAMAEGVRKIALGGSLRMIVSETFLRRAAEEGLHVREYAVPSGGSVQCTVTADDDLLIGRLAADLSGAKRVDLSICDERGLEQSRLQDIPVGSAAGGVVLHESITFAKAAPSFKMTARLISVDEAGSEHVLGEYTFDHSRSLPGPGAW